jgi:dihydroflavonol-4-reductase
MQTLKQPVAVTGGSGFVASHLVKQLLSEGYTVHATVRSLDKLDKVQPLLALQQGHPGQLALFEADLLKAGSFDKAFAGCSVVHHVASPFLLPEMIKDGRRQLLEPAVQGTRNVLHSVNRAPSVERVVMTSTIGAIFGDYIDVRQMKNGVLAEEYFNTSSTIENNPYHFSKVEAEREAWKICQDQARWSLVTINPGMVLGPSLTPTSDSGSLFLLDEMLKGYFFYGVPDLSLATVDVREVAQAHIAAARTPGAQGRYILAEREMISFLEIAKTFRRIKASPRFLPRNQIPLLLVKLIGPLFGLSQEYIRNHVGIRFPIDNSRSIRELGITYRPVQETLRDHYRSWAEQRSISAAKR